MPDVAVCVRADLPNLNLLLGWTCGNYVEVENPAEAKFCRELEVIVVLLEKGAIEHPDLDSCFLSKYSVYLATCGVYP